VWTFRQDLATCDVETMLVAPDYGLASAAPGPGVVRVSRRRRAWRSGRIAACAGARLTAALHNLTGPFDLVHYSYAISRPLCRRALRTAAEDSLRRDLSHLLCRVFCITYVPVLPRALGRGLARAVTRSQCRDVAALIAPSEPMRAVLLDYGSRRQCKSFPRGCRRTASTPAAARAFGRTGIGRRIGRSCSIYGPRRTTEKNIEFLLHVFAQVRIPRAERALRHPPAKGRRSNLCVNSHPGLGSHRTCTSVGYLDRDTELLDCYAAGGRLCVCLAHRDPGARPP